jgi:hypothetical protein
MSGEGAWERGRRAWDRLAAWQRSGRDPDAALDALDDIGVVRRVLEQAELAAVRTARGAGKSWAEIATMLGVSRQSAWERWRDLDDPARPSGPPTPGEGPITRAAAALRHRADRAVPNVIGMSWDEALERLHHKGLVAVCPDPDQPRPEAGRNDLVVTDQSPESGAIVARGTAVTLWTERRGGSGVREPRRPKLPPPAGRQLRDEQTNEAVG